MNKTRVQQLHNTAQKAHQHISNLSPQKKISLKKAGMLSMRIIQAL